jgi:hypothetical protein
MLHTYRSEALSLEPSPVVLPPDRVSLIVSISLGEKRAQLSCTRSQHTNRLLSLARVEHKLEPHPVRLKEEMPLALSPLGCPKI